MRKPDDSVTTPCKLGNFACPFCGRLIFFSKSTFSKKSFKNTVRASNSLNPGQARLYVIAVNTWPGQVKAIFFCMNLISSIGIFSSPEPKAPRELIEWDSSRRSSKRPSLHTLKHENLQDQQVNWNQISSGASLGWGKGCIRFWARSDLKSGFHSNR